MAGTRRTATDAVALERALEQHAYRFDFYQALRLLECAHPDKPRIGHSRRPKEDPVRLSQPPTMEFAPSTISAFRAGKGRPGRLEVAFAGLFGPNGALPLHLTEYARDRERNYDDPTFARFVDLFHHRMLSFFYRVWADAQPTVGLDRTDTDRFALYFGALFGIGQRSMMDREELPDSAKLFHSGTLACQTRHAAGLRAMIEQYFEIPVQIDEFVGQWTTVPEESRWRLGESPETGCLGLATLVGSQTWTAQRKFRIVVGPVGLEQYKRFMPGSGTLRRLSEMVRSYTNDELDWDLKPILEAGAVPPLRLGGVEQLGLTSWLIGAGSTQDHADLIVEPEQADTPAADSNSIANDQPSEEMQYVRD